MDLMNDTAKIAEALVAFQGEMPTIAKGKRAEVPTKAGGKYTYTYADLADVTEAAMPVLTKHGLAFSACPQRTEHGSYELVGTLLHTSGESLTGALPISGGNEQAMGSSLTYQRRYLLGSMTGIVTDDDDDGRLAQDAERRQQERQPAASGTPPDKPMTSRTRGQLFALFGKKGIAEENQLVGINTITSKSYTSRGDITEADAKEVIEVLKLRPDAPPPSKPTADDVPNPHDGNDPWVKDADVVEEPTP
jgi:hypothetical protein